MNYQTLINNIMSLGFSDESEMQEFADSGVLYDSINRAITKLNLNGFPNYETYDLEVGGDEFGYLYVVMPEIDDNFMEFRDVPVLYSTIRPKMENGAEVSVETQSYTRFNDYEIEAGDTLVIDIDAVNSKLGFSGEPATEEERINRAKYTQSFRIYYIADHEPFTGEELSEDLPLPRKAHHLVPLLASYYVWLEDDPTKAAQYYNLYEEEAKEMENRNSLNNVRIRVLPGGI